MSDRLQKILIFLGLWLITSVWLAVGVWWVENNSLSWWNDGLGLGLGLTIIRYRDFKDWRPFRARHRPSDTPRADQ